MILQPSILLSTAPDTKVSIPELDTFKTTNDLASKSDTTNIFSTNINPITADIKTLSTDVDFLSGKIDDNAEIILIHTTDISNLQSELQNKINEIQSQINMLYVNSLRAPNYTVYVNLANGTTYTAPDDGWLICSGRYTNEQEGNVIINGEKVMWVGDKATGSTFNQVVLPVRKGDIIYFGKWQDGAILRFYYML